MVVRLSASDVSVKPSGMASDNDIDDGAAAAHDTASPTNSDDEVAQLKLQLKQAQDERQEVQSQYDTLVGKVSLMKLVFTKMKLAQKELEETKEELEETKEAMVLLLEENQSLTAEIHQLKEDLAQRSKEVTEVKEANEVLNTECDKLSQQCKLFEGQIQQLNDDKYVLENNQSTHQKRALELKRQLQLKEVEVLELKQGHSELQTKLDTTETALLLAQLEKEEAEQKYRDAQAELAEQRQQHNDHQQALTTTIDDKLATIAELEGKIADLHRQLEAKADKITELEQQSLEIADLKQEVHAKQLQIGKLRHEAIILNEHLTKLLTQIKQLMGDELTRVDKELITNLIIQFLQFPRGDSKKFETLLLIALTLTWDDTQRVAAGLLLGGSAAGDGKRLKPSFAGLWTEFLEKELTKK